MIPDRSLHPYISTNRGELIFFIIGISINLLFFLLIPHITNLNHVTKIPHPWPPARSFFSFNNSQQKPIIVLLTDRLQQDAINPLIIPDILHGFPYPSYVLVGRYQILCSQ